MRTRAQEQAALRQRAYRRLGVALVLLLILGWQASGTAQEQCPCPRNHLKELLHTLRDLQISQLSSPGRNGAGQHSPFNAHQYLGACCGKDVFAPQGCSARLLLA